LFPYFLISSFLPSRRPSSLLPFIPSFLHILHFLHSFFPSFLLSFIFISLFPHFSTFLPSSSYSFLYSFPKKLRPIKSTCLPSVLPSCTFLLHSSPSFVFLPSSPPSTPSPHEECDGYTVAISASYDVYSAACTLQVEIANKNDIPTFTSQDPQYELIGMGWCASWKYLPEGGYPPHLSDSDPLYDADRVQECMNRCLAAGQEDYSTEGFYIRNSDSTCGCAQPGRTCDDRTLHGGFTSYKIGRAMESSAFMPTLLVDEHVDFGLALGPTLFATDTDVANAELSYTIVEGYGDFALNHFRISECSGLLTVNVDGLDGIDFFTKSSYALKIRVCDDGKAFNPVEPTRCTDGYDVESGTYVLPGLETLGEIVINVVDVNDAPVVSSSNFGISEGASGSEIASEVVVGRVTVSDADIPNADGRSTSDVHRYSISDPTGTFNIVDCDRVNNGDECVDSIFADGTSWPAGTVYLTSTIDYEFWRAFNIQYAVTVVVQDRVGSADSLSGSTTFSVTVLNANDPPTVACPLPDGSPSCFKFYIAENVQVDDPVVSVKGGTDPAAILGEDEDQRYADAEGYESILSYEVTGTMVNNVALSESIFTLTSVTTENGEVASGLKVRTLTFPGDYAGVEEGPGANDPIFDFESIASIYVEVTISDNGQPGDTVSTAVVVMVEVELTPVNEAPTITRGQSFSISESSCVGSACSDDDVFPGYCLVDYANYDPDNSATGGNSGAIVQDPLFYSVTGGIGSEHFAIVIGETGEPCLIQTAALDFENGICNAGCEVLLAVADRQPTTAGFLDSNVVVTYTILDADEAPTIVSESFFVNENVVSTSPTASPTASPSATPTESPTVPMPMCSNCGDRRLSQHVVGALGIADPDSGLGVFNDQGNLAVSINAETSQNGVGLFDITEYDEVMGYQLILKVGTVLNFEAFLNTYTLTIDVVDKDDATNPAALSASAVITVVVQNVNDVPLIANQEFSFGQVNEPSEISAPFMIGTLMASDDDSNPTQTLLFEIVSQSLNGGASDNTIQLNPDASAELQVNCYAESCTSSARTEDNVYTLMVQVSDSGEVDGLEDNPLTSEAALVTVRTTALNNAPEAINPVVEVTLEENTPDYIFTDNLDTWFTDQDPLTYAILNVNPSVIGGTQLFFNSEPSQDWFQINQDGAGNLALEMLVNGGFLDFESIPSGTVTITLEARDDKNAMVTMRVILSVSDINEFPEMSAQSREILESPVAGGAVGPALFAYDPDIIDQNALLWTLTNTDGTQSDLFTIDSSTGQVSINSGPLDFETDPILYQLTATVTDTTGQMVSNTITISVIDVDEPPSLSTKSPVHCSIPEDTPVNATLPACAFTANDQENDELTFTIGDATIQSIFSVSGTGEVTLKEALDFEAVDSYSFELTVTDLVNPVSASVMFTIVDVNDVPTPIVDGSLLHVTQGSEAITLTSPTGIFGPLRSKEGFVDSNQEGGAVVSVRYGVGTTNGDGQLGEPLYTAEACEIVWDGDFSSTIECETAAGVGRDLLWEVTIDGHSSVLSDVSTSYAAPSIESLGGVHQAIPTEGGVVTFNGTNFGPADIVFELMALYGQTLLGGDVDVSAGYLASECAVTVPHSQVSCTVPAGVGDQLRWQIQISNQRTATYPPIGTTTDSSYIAPSITSIADGDNLATEGGDVVILTGTHFGPTSDFNKLLITYGPAAEMKYYPACIMTIAHTEIRCTTTPGSGINHAWTIVASWQSSGPSTTLTRYKVPTLLGLSGPGSLEAGTQGGQAVVLRGGNFGPLVDGTYGTGQCCPFPSVPLQLRPCVYLYICKYMHLICVRVCLHYMYIYIYIYIYIYTHTPHRPQVMS
jgi:hypothetical protein